MATKFVLEGRADDIEEDDGWCSRQFQLVAEGSACTCTAEKDCPDCPACNGLFVRVLSWDVQGNHTEFRRLEDKKVRVTIEVVDG